MPEADMAGGPDDALEVRTGWPRILLHLLALAVTGPLAFGALSAWAREGGTRLFLVALLFAAAPLLFLMLLSGFRRPVFRLEPDGLRLHPYPFSDVLVAWQDIADVRLERHVRGRRLATCLVLELRGDAALPPARAALGRGPAPAAWRPADHPARGRGPRPIARRDRAGRGEPDRAFVTTRTAASPTLPYAVPQPSPRVT
jgi:hypothetical protein